MKVPVRLVSISPMREARAELWVMASPTYPFLTLKLHVIAKSYPSDHQLDEEPLANSADILERIGAD
jgi:hypothetical protein